MSMDIVFFVIIHMTCCDWHNKSGVQMDPYQINVDSILTYNLLNKLQKNCFLSLAQRVIYHFSGLFLD